jgi:hypothetical protein
MAASLSSSWPRWLTLATAVALLDIAVTFENRWPTPAVTWRGELSIELAVCLLALAAASRWRAAPGRTAAGWIAAAWTALTIGRYAEVTAPALYGRDINLYWDLRFIPDVVAMATRVAPARLIVVSATTVVLVFAVLYCVLRSAWRRIGGAMTDTRERRALVLLSLVTMALFIGQHARGGVLPVPSVATPVTATYVRQMRFVIDATSASTSLGASPSMDSDLSRIAAADVLVIFVE